MQVSERSEKIASEKSGSSFIILFLISPNVFPSNGNIPDSRRYKRIPSDQTSNWVSGAKFLLDTNSGGAYLIVPSFYFSFYRWSYPAIPKSMITKPELTSPFSLNIMFSSLMSRCTICLWWQKLMAQVTSYIIFWAALSLTLSPSKFFKWSAKEPPLKYSMKNMILVSGSWNTLKRRITLGWFSFCRTNASLKTLETSSALCT